MSTTKAVYPTARVAWSTLAVLILLYTSSFVDPLIIGLLVEPIKADLQVSDTQIALLVGPAFAALYSFMGLPFGRLADTYSRKKIIALGATVWAICTALCGLAGTYLQLFLVRVAVGVGAAALTPSAYSMISDLFHPKTRPIAMGVYVMAVSVGTGLAFMIGGYVISLIAGAGMTRVPLLGDLKAWQMAFVFAALPGLPLALVMLAVREPARQGLLTQSGVSPRSIPVSEVVRYVFGRWRAYGVIILPSCLLTSLSYAMFAWIPTYFIRVHGWSAGKTGLTFGACVLVSGVFATTSGGALCSRLLDKGRKDAYPMVLLLASIGILPFIVAGPLMSGAMLSLALLTAANFFISSWGGPAAAGLHALSPNQMRAQVSALYLFAVNITGMTLGPLMVGVMTDRVFGDPLALGNSLAVTGLVLTPPAIWLLWRGRRGFGEFVD